MSVEDKLYGLLKIYKNLPYPIKNVIGKFYRVLPNKIKYGNFYFSYLNRTKKDSFSQKELLEKQIALAVNKIPYYKDQKFNTISDFPIINKSIIKSRFNEFIDNNRQDFIKTNTGGSSGTPFEFLLEKGVSRPKEKAHFDWYWKKFGYSPGDKMLMIRGEALAGNKLYEYQAIENKLAISCYLINDSNVKEVIKIINKFNPKFIHAYPSAIKNFISLTSANSLKIDVKAIFLGSEGLLISDKRNIESFFKSKIAHWYGHSERLIHAGNCPYSDEFHIFAFYGYAELVDENQNVIDEPNKVGKIVATGFDNSIMPFLRYDTGDEAEYSENENCKCGFKGKSFKRINGRSQDFIYLIDKTKVSLTAFIFGQHFEEFSVIREMQLEQEEYGKVLIRIVLQNNNEFDSLKFIDKLIQSVKNKIKVEVNIVESIEKTPRGKHVFLIQKIKS